MYIENHNMRLFKLTEGYILTSDEVIKEGELGFSINDATYTHHNHLGVDYGKKIIASTFHPKLHKIDFSDLSEENCKKIGWFDVEDMARRWCTMQTTRSTDYWRSMVSVYIEGFQKALELLSEKRFTEEDMVSIFHMGHQVGMNTLLSIQQGKVEPDVEKIRNETIQSLSQPKSWEVEVEMELIDVDYAWSLYQDDTTRQFHFHHYDSGLKTFKKAFIHLYKQPKVTSNKIKIIKVL